MSVAPEQPASRECIQVLLADEQHFIRAGLRAVLNAESGIRVIGETGDGLTALKLATELKPNVLLIDVRVPLLDGIEVARRVIDNAEDRRAKVLVLAGSDSAERVVDAIRAGVSGFIFKDSPPERLVAAVRAVAAGEAVLDPRATQKVFSTLERLPSLPQGDPVEIAELSDREFTVLRLLARGFSNAEISQLLHVSENTVKTHVRAVLRKLGLRNRGQAIVFAHEIGVARRAASAHSERQDGGAHTPRRRRQG